MCEEIKINLGDWQYNAGIVGFINILKYSGDIYLLENDELTVKADVLNNFEEKYFNYFINKYEKILGWYKVINIESFIEKHEKEKFQNFNEKEDLKKLNDYITNTKTLLSKKSHIAAYKLMSAEYDFVEASKKLISIKIKKNKTVNDEIDNIKNNFKIIKEIIENYKKDDSKKFIAGINIIYTVIKNGWNNVSFLNRQVKENNFYKAYKDYFVDSAVNYLKEDKIKLKYKCHKCGNKIKNFDIDMGFLNCTGFDTSRKTSHVWNFSNDISICPLCFLIYSCLPAGFNYISNKGIFINYNHNIEDLVKVNYNISNDIFKDAELNQKTTYKALINSITKSFTESVRYELSDIQVVRYENEKYKFNILSKNLLNVINKSKDDLNNIIKCGFIEVKTFFSLYDEVIIALFNSVNLFYLIQRIFIVKLSKPENSKFGINHIINILNINFEYLKEVGYMEKVEKDNIRYYKTAGYYLKQAYKEKNSENKLNGISYKLLNSLKTNNHAMFMDTILNCYLYTGKQVPDFFVDCLKETETFKTIGYAFVAGIIDGDTK